MIQYVRQFHVVHAVTDRDTYHRLDDFLQDVFGAQTFMQGYAPPRDRDASLVLIGELCVEPLSKRWSQPERPDDSVRDWIRKHGQGHHSMAFIVKDLNQAYAHMAEHGLGVDAYSDFAKIYFFTHPRDTFDAVFEICGVESPNDPRKNPEWSATWWRDHHPLGIERLSSFSAVVGDLEGPNKVWRDHLGFQPLGERSVEGLGKVASFWVGGTVLELVQPTAPGALASEYFKSRGQGWFSLNFKVQSAHQAAAYLRSKGLRLVGDTRTRFSVDPRDSFGGVYSFVQEDIPGDPRVK